LKNGEADLNVIEPTRMNWAMDEDQVGIALVETCSGARTTTGKAVIHDPENSSGLGIGWLEHHLFHRQIERRDPSYKTHRVSAVDASFVVPHAATQNVVELSRWGIRYTSMRYTLGAPAAVYSTSSACRA
jgi:hypothetical protein